MKRSLILLVLFFICLFSFSQKSRYFDDRNILIVKEDSAQDKSKVNVNDSNKIYLSVEQNPEFPGGHAALLKYIDSHIQYPLQPVGFEQEGHVVAQFVVEKDGHVSNVNIVRSNNKVFEKEAMRVCKSLPMFSPGRINGEPVRVWFTMRVKFKLPTKELYSNRIDANDDKSEQKSKSEVQDMPQYISPYLNFEENASIQRFLKSISYRNVLKNRLQDDIDNRTNNLPNEIVTYQGLIYRLPKKQKESKEP